MDDRTAKAFDFAADTVKQILALSAGIIALTVTFSQGILKNHNSCVEHLLIWAWGCYLASILFGVLTLMALTSAVSSATEPTPTTLYDNRLRVWAVFLILTFFAALVLTVICGSMAI